MQKVKCRHMLCSDEIQRNQLESHESSCPKKVVICEHCKVYTATYQRVVQHWGTCGEVPVTCPNDGCEAKVKRSNVIKHVSERCPYTAVDCCCYRFCRTCIEPLIPNKRCPLCNCRFTVVIADKLLQRTLNQKQVYCTHKTSGCEWTGELVDQDKHLNAKPGREKRLQGCPTQKIKCS